MKQFKNGWRFYPKIEELLSRDSTAHGAATYNPSAVSAASAATADDGDPEDTLLGPSTSDGPSPSTADVVTSEPISWNIPHLNTEQPVASTSVAVAPPLSSASSSGKRTFSNMLFECSTAASTSTSQMSDALSDKKLKLSTKGSSRSHVSSGKRAVKEAASTAALMNLQGTVNRLVDSLSKAFLSTDEARVADDRSTAMLALQNEDSFMDEDKIVLVHAFMRAPVICSTYNQLTQENLCLTFLQSIIEQAGANFNL
jgi:hypothetical protein